MVPWSFLLKNSPLIIAGAEALLTRLRSGQVQREATDPADRLTRLEESSTETANLLHQLAQQVNTLAAAQRATAKRVQIALVVGLVAVMFSVIACLIVLLQ